MRKRVKRAIVVALVVGSILAVVLCTGIVLLVLSFQSVPVGNVGLKYKRSTKLVVSNTTFPAKTHLMWLAYGFYLYPTAMQGVDLNTPANTSDGEDVWFHASFGYFVKQPEVAQTYWQQGGPWNKTYILSRLNTDIVGPMARNYTRAAITNVQNGETVLADYTARARKVLDRLHCRLPDDAVKLNVTASP